MLKSWIDCLSLLAVVLILPVPAVYSQLSEPGIYLTGPDDRGAQIVRNDGGGTLNLLRRVHKSFGHATISSQSNDNELFRLQLTYDETLPAEVRSATAVLGFGEDYLVVNSWGSNSDEELFTLGATIHGEEAAIRIAEKLEITPFLRAHPGHALQTRFIPSKAAFDIGEPVVVTLEVKNVGTEPVSFMDGGMQRGPRNNQFKFIAFGGYGSGPAIPDTGDPSNFGGIAGLVTLASGETFTKTVGLNDWFQLDEGDSYQITGLFEMNLVNDDMTTIWEDFVVGTFVVRIQEKD